MKLSAVAVDPKAIEDGEWVTDLPEMDDLELKCRGQSSKLWRDEQQRLLRKLPAALRNRPDGLPNHVGDELNNKLLVKVGIIDWKNLELDDGLKPYSPDLLAKLLSDPVYQVFRTACLIATARVGTNTAAADEELAKNSPTSSHGNSAMEEGRQAG